MATEIRLPDAGEGIEDVTVSRWRVAVGDAVNAGDVILEVATDKVDTEIQAPTSGVLLKINFRDGEIAPVSAVMGYIGEAGESVDEAAPAAAAPADKSAPDEPATESATTESGITESAITESKATESAGVKASPVAKRVAAEKGVDLAGVAGTGPGGQITKHDVLAAKEAAQGAVGTALPGELADESSLPVRRAAAEH
ncbi:MAG: biotin/lipoyl-containing protein, partial [Caldilinea sp.]